MAAEICLPQSQGPEPGPDDHVGCCVPHPIPIAGCWVDDYQSTGAHARSMTPRVAFPDHHAVLRSGWQAMSSLGSCNGFVFVPLVSFLFIDILLRAACSHRPQPASSSYRTPPLEIFSTQLISWLVLLPARLSISRRPPHHRRGLDDRPPVRAPHCGISIEAPSLRPRSRRHTARIIVGHTPP